MVIVAVGASVSDLSLRSLKLILTVGGVRLQECSRNIRHAAVDISDTFSLSNAFTFYTFTYFVVKFNYCAFFVASVLIGVQCDVVSTSCEFR